MAITGKSMGKKQLGILTVGQLFGHRSQRCFYRIIVTNLTNLGSLDSFEGILTDGDQPYSCGLYMFSMVKIWNHQIETTLKQPF